MLVTRDVACDGDPEAIKGQRNIAVSAFCLQQAFCVTVLSYLVLFVYLNIYMANTEKRLRRCASPCSRYLSEGDTHSFCVVCLGVEHARAVLEGAVCANCFQLSMRELRSRLSLFDQSDQARVSSASGPASVEAARRLYAWDSHVELADNTETVATLSQCLLTSSTGLAHGSEARAAASSDRVKDTAFDLSGSEGLDIINTESHRYGDSPPHIPIIEELLEVVTRAVLN